MTKPFPFTFQLDAMDCGPACLRMVARHYGRSYTLQTLRQRSFITREGVSMLGISDAAESIGFRTTGIKINFEQLCNDVPLPCIAHWNQNHFVVVYRIKKRREGKVTVHVADPAHGLAQYSEEEFMRCWGSTKVEGKDCGTALALLPGPEFHDMEDEKKAEERNIGFFFRYLRPYKSQLVQLALGMLTGSLLQMIFPFLTQALVDNGIRNHNLSFITLVLIAQLVLFLARLSVDFIRSWIMLHMTARINISLISDFLAKLMRLPMNYFDTKMVGDIMQRIGDHGRIESFLTGSSLSVVFSLFNFIVFGAILAYYNLTVLMIFLIGNALYVAWILSFMRWRRKLDFKRFAQASANQSNVVQLITGMQEIKLNNCEKQKRWEWERIKVKQFKISIQGLALGQYQQLGSVFFSQTTNILISFIAAKAVVEGQMTLGMMMSLTYIVGQVSAPIGEFIGFARAWQDAKISLERLGEVHLKEDEDQQSATRMTILPQDTTIRISDLYFSYDGADRDYVLEGVDLSIPHNRVTAIVGASGSGKTTLVKLMLGFYQPNRGGVKVGETALQNINPHLWRAKTAAVLQDGFIFSDTIAGNIAVGDEVIDRERLVEAAKIANIGEFIDSLPLGYNTRIGMEGTGVSQGQKQRILIARAVYHNPEFIFFDEATNALDAKNEREIMEHLEKFYRGRTAVIVAHRLSTVRHADNIVVLDKGRVAEQGTHGELTERRGIYYDLVKNQLELGN
ncbi:MAG: peptidase domain-containing ABC transporter [Bacteroidales bacterium]|nr:peptidase domain-containing ABC transporter [Bacteroidales bacterium]